MNKIITTEDDRQDLIMALESNIRHYTEKLEKLKLDLKYIENKASITIKELYDNIEKYFERGSITDGNIMNITLNENIYFTIKQKDIIKEYIKNVDHEIYNIKILNDYKN